MTFAAIFALAVGVAMIRQWLFSYLSNQIPELVDDPIEIRFHIAAEMVTAICLTVSGVGMLARQSWGVPVFLIAAGMLFYTLILSPAYFIKKNEWGWVGLFALLLVLGITSVVFII